MSIFLRSDLEWLAATRPKNPEDDLLSSPASQVLELLTARGAMFAADLARQTQMLPSQIEDVLGELVTRGLVTADGFGGLRQLIRGSGHNGHSSPHLKRHRAGLARKRIVGRRHRPLVALATRDRRGAS